jgi:hypothetical protein
MKALEDKLRAALRETGEEIGPHTVPPLYLDQPGGRVRLPGTDDRGRWWGWLTPLAAAAAVAVVVIASVAIGKAFAGRQQQGTSALPAGLPKYYVALRFSGHNTCCRIRQPLVPRTHAVIVDTATGAVLATIAPPNRQDTFAGVTAAADDRTFVLGVQRYGTVAPTRFYLLRIHPAGFPGPARAVFPTVPASPTGLATPVISTSTASPSPGPPVASTGSASPTSLAPPVISPDPAGSASHGVAVHWSISVGPASPPVPSASSSGPASTASPTSPTTPVISPGPSISLVPAPRPSTPDRLWSLHLLPIPADTADLANFALSPRGTSLAVLDLGVLHVFDLATGIGRAWHRPPCFTGSFLGGANTDAMLSWAADNRNLAFACNSLPDRFGVWLLNTTGPGISLIKGVPNLVLGPRVKANSQPPWRRVLLTGDGRTVVGVLEVQDPHHPAADPPLQEIAEFSAHTGKLVRVINRMPVWNWIDFEQVLWASPSGHTLLVSDTKPYHGRRRAIFLLNDAGVLTGHHFTPLPHWSLDTLAAAW